MIRNATDPDSTVYDTNRVGDAFQYGFTPAQVGLRFYHFLKFDIAVASHRATPVSL